MLNLTTEDRELLKARGVTQEQLEQQVEPLPAVAQG